MTGKHAITRLFALVLALAVLLPLCVGGREALAAGGDWAGSGTRKDPWIIADAQDLIVLAERVNEGNVYSGNYFRLAGDVDLSGVCGSGVGSWTPIGSGEGKVFGGIFDGGGNSITGLYIDSKEDYRGLFGFFKGTLKDLSVSGRVAGKSHVGGIVGKILCGAVMGCSFSGEVTSGGDDIGGIAADCWGGLVEDCSNSGAVTGRKYIGGAVGYCYSGGSVIHCTNSGNVSGVYIIGGVVGKMSYGRDGNPGPGEWDLEGGNEFSFMEASLIGCVNTGSVTGTGDDVGGIAGSASTITVSHCRNVCPDANNYDSGGNIVGVKNVGGVLGSLYRCTVTLCTNTGAVLSTYNVGYVNCYCGGIVGEDATKGSGNQLITKCCNYGPVSSAESDASFIGGIVGGMQDQTITQCFNAGPIGNSSGFSIGGIAGDAKGNASIENCFNFGIISGLCDLGGIVGYAKINTIVNNCYGIKRPTCEKGYGIDFSNYCGDLVGDYSGDPGVTLKSCYYIHDEWGVGWYKHENPGCYERISGMNKESSYSDDWDFENVWIMSKINDGLVELEAPVLRFMVNGELADAPQAKQVVITSLKQLKTFRDRVNSGVTYAGSTVNLTVDLDLGAGTWTPIGTASGQSFKGVFDGGGHAITNLKCSTDSGCSGLFGCLGGTVKDLLVTGCVTDSSSDSGGAGGIAGAVESGGGIERCAFIGDVTSSACAAGGIAGINRGKISDSFHSGTVKSGSSAGGVVGWSAYKADNVQNCCHFSGSVSCGASNKAGGIAGSCDARKIGNQAKWKLDYGFSNCYYLDSSSGCGIGTAVPINETSSYYTKTNITEDGAAEPLSAEKFKDIKSFTGWDFENVWAPGADSPRLRCMSVEVYIDKNDPGDVCASGAMPESIWVLRGVEGIHSAFTPNEGYMFGGWNLNADGSGQGIADYGCVPGDMEGELTLYAQWIKATQYAKTSGGGRNYTATAASCADHTGADRQSPFVKLNYTNLLDGDDSTAWSVSSLRFGDVWSLEFYTADALRPSAFSMCTAKDISGAPGSNPRGWTLQGKAHSNDGWVTLAESGELTAPLPARNSTTCCYGVTCGEELYSFFRISFSGLGEGYSDFRLAEFTLYTADPENDVRRPVRLDPNGAAGEAIFLPGGNMTEIELPDVADDMFSGWTVQGNFRGWNTEADGSGTTYKAGDKLKADGVTDLYAQWDPLKVTWLGENDAVLAETEVKVGETPVYSGPDPTMTGGDGFFYTFAGWDPSPAPITADQTYRAKFDRTDRLPTPQAVFTATGPDSGTLTNVKAGMAYAIDGGEEISISGTEVTLTNVAPCTIEVWEKGSGTDTPDSAKQSIEVTRAEAPSLKVTQPSTIGGTGSIATTKAHEYSSDGGKTWTACAGKITCLEPGTYYVRVMASGTVLASSSQKAVINEFIPGAEPTPEAVFTASGASGGTLTNVSAGMVYSIDGGPEKDITGGAAALADLKPCTITVIKKGNGSTTADSPAQTIEVTRAETPSLKASQPGNGVVTGSIPTTSSHEISSDGKTWTKCAGKTERLAPGTYLVRVAAKGAVLASPAQSITIEDLGESRILSVAVDGAAPAAPFPGDGFTVTVSLKLAAAVKTDSARTAAALYSPEGRLISCAFGTLTGDGGAGEYSSKLTVNGGGAGSLKVSLLTADGWTPLAAAEVY